MTKNPARVNQHPPMHQLAVLSMGWAAWAAFSFSLHQSTFFLNLFMSFFGGQFFLDLDLHTTFPPSYPTDLAILLN
jgi:hypothetical protein